MLKPYGNKCNKSACNNSSTYTSIAIIFYKKCNKKHCDTRNTCNNPILLFILLIHFNSIFHQMNNDCILLKKLDFFFLSF